MGEGIIDESKLPPKAKSAYRAAMAILRCAEVSNAYLQARQRVIDALPDGLARDISLDALEANYRMQILHASSPRPYLQGGVVVGINQPVAWTGRDG